MPHPGNPAQRSHMSSVTWHGIPIAKSQPVSPAKARAAWTAAGTSQITLSGVPAPPRAQILVASWWRTPGRALRASAQHAAGHRTPGTVLTGSHPAGSCERSRARGVPGRHACWWAEHGGRHGGLDTRRLDLAPLQAGRPADRPPVTQGRTEGPTAGIGSGILIARGDSSPRQNIMFGAPRV